VNESAHLYLEMFLTYHCFYDENGIDREVKPVWDNKHLEGFIKNLQLHGYGWPQPEGVRQQLDQMTAG
jgi:hypothetical protein